MLDFDKVSKVCDAFIDQKQLTTKELNQLGFSSNAINELIESSIIKRVERGIYEIESVRFLVDYSKKMLKEGNVEQYQMALERVLEIEPENITMNYKFLYTTLVQKKFDLVIKCLDRLSDIKSDIHRPDLNLWILLLSYSTTLPERYNEVIRKMTLEDILILDEDDRYFDKHSTNKIRKLIFSKRLKSARELIFQTSEYVQKRHFSLITYKALAMACQNKKEKRDHDIELIDNKEYKQVKERLKKIKDISGLSFSEECIYYLISDLAFIKENNRMPSSVVGAESDNLINMLRCRRYKEALACCEQINIRTGHTDALVEKLLRIVLSEADRIFEEQKQLIMDDFNIEVFADLLHSDNIDVAIVGLEKYLVRENKSKFKRFMVDLIELSKIKGDINYCEPLFTLSKIIKGEEDFDLSIYVHDFYYNLANKDYQAAQLCLHILSLSSTIGNNKIDISGMKKELYDESSLTLSDEKFIDHIIADDELCCLGDVLEKVLETGDIAMLEPMSADKVQSILNVTSRIRNIQTSIINEGNNKRRLFFRNIDIRAPFIPISDYLRQANTKYLEKDYDGCIDLLKPVLRKVVVPKSFIYADMGLSYYYRNQPEDATKAIDYLTLADFTNNGKERFDYKTIINKLKEKTGYDGIRIDFESDASKGILENGFQYKK